MEPGRLVMIYLCVAVFDIKALLLVFPWLAEGFDGILETTPRSIV